MIELGYRRREVREGFWRGDPDVDWTATPEPARKAWEASGEGCHLTLRSGGKPMRVAFRALTAEERNIIDSVCVVATAEGEGEARRVTVANLWAVRRDLLFAVGADLPDLPEKVTVGDPIGKVEIAKHESRHGLRMLSRQMLQALHDSPHAGSEMIDFFAGLIDRGARASSEDFSPSSSVSTPTSSAQSGTPTTTPPSAGTASPPASNGSGSAPISANATPPLPAPAS